MAKARKQTNHTGHEPKKTRIGKGKNTKWGSKGGGLGGSTVSKCYRKKYRGQGK